MATQCLVADHVPVGLECCDLRFADSTVVFGKLFLQRVERADQAWGTFLELSVIEEHYPTGHWHLLDDLTHGCNATPIVNLVFNVKDEIRWKIYLR